LHDAAETGHRETVEKFLDGIEKKRIELPPQSYGTFSTMRPPSPLAFALIEGHYEIAKRLYECGIKSNPDLLTDLSYCGRHASLEHFKKIHLFITDNKILIEDKMVQAAIQSGNPEIKKWYRENYPEIFKKLGKELFAGAAKDKNLPALKFLLETDLSMNGDNFPEALAIATEQRDPKVFALLFEKIPVARESFLKGILSRVFYSDALNIFKYLLKCCNHLDEKQITDALGEIKKLFGHPRNVPLQLFIYLLVKRASLEEIKEALVLTKGFCDRYDESLLSKEKFFSEVFEQIFLIFQKELLKQEGVLQKIYQIIEKATKKRQVALFFNALQSAF